MLFYVLLLIHIKFLSAHKDTKKKRYIQIYRSFYSLFIKFPTFYGRRPTGRCRYRTVEDLQDAVATGRSKTYRTLSLQDDRRPTGRGATGRAEPYRTLSLQDGRRPTGRCAIGRAETYRTRSYRTGRDLQDAVATGRSKTYRTLRYRTGRALQDAVATGRSKTYRTRSYRTVGALQDAELQDGQSPTGRCAGEEVKQKHRREVGALWEEEYDRLGIIYTLYTYKQKTRNELLFGSWCGCFSRERN